LYNRCFPIVQNQLLQRRIKNNDHEARTKLWIEIADRLYFEEVGRDTPTDRDMQAELDKHQAWHDQCLKEKTCVSLNNNDRKHIKNTVNYMASATIPRPNVTLYNNLKPNKEEDVTNAH
jgi:hypothetical protein